MRTNDKDKPVTGKASKTINFDKVVLMKLEERAQKSGSTVSNIVNTLLRPAVLTDASYYREMAKHHYLKFQEMNFMKEQCEIQVTAR